MKKDNSLYISIAIALFVHIAVIAMYGIFSGGQVITTAKKIKIRLGDETIEEIVIVEEEKKPEPEQKEVEEVLQKPTEEPAKKIVEKEVVKQPPKKKVKTKGSQYGNSNAKDAISAPTYLDLLRVTVQERSAIPYEARQKQRYGDAILRLSFNRKGYVLKYSLVRQTNYEILDNAALQVGKSLTLAPFPPVPSDFDRGYSVMTYDFPISFQP